MGKLKIALVLCMLGCSAPADGAPEDGSIARDTLDAGARRETGSRDAGSVHDSDSAVDVGSDMDAASAPLDAALARDAAMAHDATMGPDAAGRGDAGIPSPGCGTPVLDWAIVAGPGTLRLGDIEVASDGTIIVGGELAGGGIFGAGTPVATMLAGGVYGSPVVLRYSPAGAFLSGVAFSGEGGVHDIALIGSDVIVAGSFATSLVLDRDLPTERRLSATGTGHDIFVARINTSNRAVWARSAGGTSFNWDGALGVAVAPDSSIYVTGLCQSSDAMFEAVGLACTRDDSFLARYHADGSFAWVRRASSDGTTLSPRHVTTLADSSVIWSGDFEETIALDDGAGGSRELSTSSVGYVIARYDTAGVLSWARRVHSTVGGPVVRAPSGAIHALVTAGSDAVFGEGEPTATNALAYGQALARYRTDGAFLSVTEINRGNSITSHASIDVNADSATLTGGLWWYSRTFETSPPFTSDVEGSFIGCVPGTGPLAWILRFDSGALMYRPRSGIVEAVRFTPMHELVGAGIIGSTARILDGVSEPVELTGGIYQNAFLFKYTL